jgi:hypothetical protein
MDNDFVDYIAREQGPPDLPILPPSSITRWFIDQLI